MLKVIVSGPGKLDASLAWFPALAEEAGLGIFGRFGITDLLDRNARLARRLESALAAEGSAFRPFAEQHRSTIVSVPESDPESVLARFRHANVVASVHGGRMRLADHF